MRETFPTDEHNARFGLIHSQLAEVTLPVLQSTGGGKAGAIEWHVRSDANGQIMVIRDGLPYCWLTDVAVGGYDHHEGRFEPLAELLDPKDVRLLLNQLRLIIQLYDMMPKPGDPEDGFDVV